MGRAKYFAGQLRVMIYRSRSKTFAVPKANAEESWNTDKTRPLSIAGSTKKKRNAFESWGTNNKDRIQIFSNERCLEIMFQNFTDILFLAVVEKRRRSGFLRQSSAWRLLEISFNFPE